MHIKIILLTGAGLICLGLGAIGLFLPVFPTTPFVLLSAACFTCTPRLRKKIMGIPFFREHIENYETRTGLTPRTTGISLGYLWGMLLLSMILVQRVWIILLLGFIGSAVTVHILWISRARLTKEEEE